MRWCASSSCISLQRSVWSGCAGDCGAHWSTQVVARVESARASTLEVAADPGGNSDLLTMVHRSIQHGGRRCGARSFASSADSLSSSLAVADREATRVHDLHGCESGARLYNGKALFDAQHYICTASCNALSLPTPRGLAVLRITCTASDCPRWAPPRADAAAAAPSAAMPLDSPAPETNGRHASFCGLCRFPRLPPRPTSP